MFKINLRRFIIKAITYIMGFMAMLGVCAIDSDSIVPMIMVVVGAAWCFLYYLANYNGEEY